jgi:outer membrane immunogenic protein
MLCQLGRARIVAPRQGGRRVGPFKSLTAVSLLALLSTAALAPVQAADFGGKVSSSSPNEDDFGFRAPTVFDWSGTYVGGHVGGAWGDVDWSRVEGLEVSHEVDGWLAGGHVGFNQQFGRWVGGVEVSLSEGDVESGDDDSFRRDFGTKTEIGSPFLATVRLGYAFDRSLAYVKGGYASADVKLRGGDGDVALSSSERQAGMTIGGGFEYALTNGVTK